MTRDRKLIVTIFLVLISSGFLFWQGINPPERISPSTPKTSSNDSSEILGDQSETNSLRESARVIRVIDGDTIEVEYQGEGKKLRYIGVDTPETVDPNRPKGCFGKEASNENKRLVEGKEVILEKDVSETDRFGRLLRSVYLKLDDGSLLFINDYLIRQGYAQASTYPPDVKYSDQFRQAEQEARENNRGLWGACTG